MGLFHLITWDVLPEVYQCLITHVFVLESIMIMCKTEAADMYMYFDSHPPHFTHLQMTGD